MRMIKSANDIATGAKAQSKSPEDVEDEDAAVAAAADPEAEEAAAAAAAPFPELAAAAAAAACRDMRTLALALNREWELSGSISRYCIHFPNYGDTSSLIASFICDHWLDSLVCWLQSDVRQLFSYIHEQT